MRNCMLSPVAVRRWKHLGLNPNHGNSSGTMCSRQRVELFVPLHAHYQKQFVEKEELTPDTYWLLLAWSHRRPVSGQLRL